MVFTHLEFQNRWLYPLIRQGFEHPRDTSIEKETPTRFMSSLIPQREIERETQQHSDSSM